MRRLMIVILCAVAGCKHPVPATYDVSAFAGSTADAQISACLAGIPKGGTCDATGYGATTQVIASTVQVGMYPAVTGFQRVNFSQATRFQPDRPDRIMFKLGPYADVSGLYVDAQNQPDYAAPAVLAVGYLMLGNSTYVAAHIKDFVLIGGANRKQGGAGIELITPDANGSTYYVTVSDGSIGGFYSDILLYAPPNSVGGVNSNSFSHLRLGKAAYSIELNGSSGWTGGPALQLSGNSFMDISAQGIPGVTQAHLYLHGAVAGNTFLAMQLWDIAPTVLTVSSGTSAKQTGVYSNYFQGWLYPIDDRAASGNSASLNTWDCANCTSNESQRNAIKAKAVGVGTK